MVMWLKTLFYRWFNFVSSNQQKMIYFLIILTSLIASFLTFFSGFGLGTLLLPVFAMYYPLPIAIGLTACVHLLNNIFKLGLVYKHIHWPLVIRFGVPSAVAAFFGAVLLKQISNNSFEITSYTINNSLFVITWQGLIVGVLIILFSLVELSKKLSAITFNEKYLSLGGLLSGFFGGFSGHQGAIRSAFLLRLNLEKQIYIATGVFIACLIDIIRLTLYSNLSIINSKQTNFTLLTLAVFSAWVGAFIGNKLFKKTSLQFFKWFVALFMMFMGVLICLGVFK
jgi:uncharacterized protein